METPAAHPAPFSPQLHEQVQRILASRTFAGSETMRHLLAYLARHAEQHPGQVPKEQEIAVTLLGRPADFDAKLDPVVRVQASRLRSKLAEYYVAEGAADEIYIDVPKGTYVLHATSRTAPQTGRPGPVQPPLAPSRWNRWLAFGPIAAVLLAVAAIGVWRFQDSAADAPLRRFWSPFLSSATEPLAVFANPKLVGSSGSALRLFDPARDQAATVNPGYAGVGEVMSAGALARLFTRFGRTIRFKPSQLFTWDDANAHNLIFIGAPPHNVSLFQVPLGRKLRFKPYDTEPRRNEGCVQNLEPKSGEQEYYCTSAEGPTYSEYALVTLTQGTARSRMVLFAAGTTTFGTQAAVEFLCDPARVPEIARALGLPEADALPPFEALLRCRIRSSVPVGTDLVLVKR